MRHCTVWLSLHQLLVHSQSIKHEKVPPFVYAKDPVVQVLAAKLYVAEIASSTKSHACQSFIILIKHIKPKSQIALRILVGVASTYCH
jgi:hypothetical protein